MSKQTAIANINSMILQEREQGTTRKKHSSLDTIDRLLEEEREKEQQEKEQRRQEDYQRQYSQFQAERNADLAEWIRGTSPTALEDRAQQARIDAMNGITSSGTQHQGNGRSFETKLEIPSPSSTGATSGKKRAQDSIYLKHLDQEDAAAQNTQAQRRSYTAPAAERTKNDRTYGLKPSANRVTPVAAGNIDLNDRPVYRNEDGSISTVDSVSFRTDDGREVLVPTIGRDAEGNAVRWTNEEAWQHYLDTGEHLGIFNSVEDADKYAQSLHKSQEKKYSSRRTVSEIYNDTATMTRWRELAGKDKLTAEEKKEAQAAVKDLKYAFNHWSAAPTGAEMAQQTELTNLYNSLLYKSSALASGFAGAVKALGIDWFSDRLTGITEKALKAESPYTSLRQITEEAQAANPLAFAAGSMTASITEMSAISGIVGEVMQGVQWFTQAAPWIQRAVSSAITFGISGLQSGITSTQSKEEWDEQERKKSELAADFGAEYTQKEYSAVRQAANVWLSTVTGALAGAAGGALETAFGIGTTEALKKAGLQFHTPLRLLAKGLTGTGFAIGSTAVQEVSKFLQYPEGYTPSVSEIGTNLAIAFLYSTISATLSETKNIKSNRETLQKLMNVLSAKYDAAERQMAGLTGIERAEAAGEVAALTNRIRESINNSPGMSGVDKEILALLQMMDDRMAAIIAGGNGLLGAGDIMAQAEAAGFSPNTALSLPAWDGASTQPTNLEQAVQIIGANVPAPMGETIALPEAPVQANNLPAWYAAFQNAPRPIDQPMRQIPEIRQAAQALAEQTHAETPETQQRDRQTRPVRAALDKINAGEQLTRQDINAIIYDYSALSELRRAGVLEGLVAPNSEGVTKISAAIQAMAAQEQYDEARSALGISDSYPNTPPVPGETSPTLRVASQEGTATAAARDLSTASRSPSPEGEATAAAGTDAKAKRAAQQALATQRKRALADNSPQSLQEMGFQTAGEGTTHIFAENQWDGEMQALAEGLRAEGIEPTFFTGNAMNAEGKKVPTLLEGNKLAIQADNRSKTIQTLAEQALGHSIAETEERIAATPRLTVRSGNDMLTENRTEAGNETQRQPGGSAAGAEEARAALLDGDGRRTDGQRAGEQAGGLEQSAAEREQAARQRQTAADRRSVSRNYGTEKVDNRSGLGITGAVAGSSTVVSERQVQADPELRRISDVLRQKTGLPTTFTLGNVEIEDAPQGARAVYTGDRFILRADHDSYTATQLGLHELYHWYAEKDPTLNERMRQRILEASKGPELMDTIARYVDAIGPSMGMTEDISEADYQQAKAAIREEIYANAYSGINAYGANAGQFTEEARAETAATERNLRETEAATAGRTGPPVPALRVGGSKPRTAAEAVGRYSLNPQTIDYAIRYTAKDEQVKNQLALIRDGTVELADIQNTITKSLGRKSSRNIHDMNDYLQKHRKVWQRMWDIQQELADNGIRTDFVTMPGTKNVIDGKKVPGGLKGLPIEYVASTTGKRFKFTAFWRNIPQMLLDSMTHDSRERLRTEIVRGVEDAYRRKTGEKDLMPYLKDQFPIPKKREIEKVAGERKLKNIRNQTQKRVQSPIRDAEKTVGALNLNSACPMFTIGNNGCYLDACYLTQMANGATGTNLFRSAWYTGEILQIAQSDIDLMNELGGLRVNGVGDTTLENKSQMKDALRHAGMRGLKVKIITKQRASLEVLKEMHDAGEDVSHITVQPSMDNLWIPAKLDDAYGAGVRGNTQLAQTVKAGKLEAAAAGYDDMFGRATKIEDGVLYRKYGFTPEQIRQMQEDFPFVSITPRYVVCTPREVAEIALNRNGEFVNGGKLIQTLMHGKVPEGCISDYGKRSDNDPGGAIINFGGARHVVERKDGKWHFFGEYIKKDGSVGKIIDGPRTPYGRVQAFIENNYTKAEQDKIWLTLKNQMCCQANDFKDACAGCQSLCARGCAAFSSEDFDYRKYSEREKAQAMSLDEPIGKLRVAGQEPVEQPVQEKLRVAQGNKPKRTMKFSADEPQSSAEYAQMNRRDAESAERAQDALEERTLGGRRLLDTPALKKIGVKVNGSVGRYANTQQLLAKNKAAKELKKQAQDAEKRLRATDAEIDFASGIAAGVYDEEDIPERLRKDVVMELADYYFASDSANLDTLIRVRADINRGLLLEAEDLMDDLDIKPQNMVLLNERTPERNLRAMFGERGDQIAEWLVQPVRENEAEKIRWFNKQMDRVREFTDSKGQQRELTREESALTMKVMEGRAAAEMIADLETNPKNRYGKQQAKNIKNAAENIRKGGSAADAAKEFSLGDRERDLAEKYAAWQNTLEELKQADSTIVENAAKEYARIFDEFYEAINDFLAAHGYEPIGYIKGYAPHMQPEENQNLLEKAFGAMGINTQVTELPANIAGQTANYKPFKRWNPYFLQRTGSVAQYDIVKAYESYVDYLSDIFYHTDDIMRARQLVRWIRKSYAKDEIKSQLDYIETIREAPIEVKQTLLRDAGEIGQTSVLSPMDVEEKMQEYVEKLFSRVTDSTRYSNLVMWLENYANILAGKQSFADRGWEYSTGRKSLNWANRLNAAFQKANVAGNLSSAINQTAQIPMIAAELGERDFLTAVYDVVSGRVRQGNFLQDSDFLMEKEGKDYLYADRADKFINALFTPASVADHLVSTVAVRGAFNKAIREGKSYAEAMRYADDFGRKLMGSRAKGSRPLAYESKGFFSKMIHQFQVECANSWDHIVSDLPNEFKQIEKEQGKSKAIRALAGVLVRAIVGTFILNRLTDELYGGTPAPFDILGLTANFIASGQGLTTNDWIRKVIDNGMEKVTGQRIFGTKDTETKFSLKDATEELIYNVMNDLPLARNVAGVLGLGDQTIPLPGASGEFSAMKKAVDGMLEDGVDKDDIEALLRATFQAASQFVPGGRQLRKTAEGAEAVIRGGSYKNGKLQYPVEGFGDTARALAFGKNATQAAREYWAAGGKALSDKQTGIYEGLLDEGMSRQEAYDTITGYRDEGTLNDFVKWQDSRSKTAGVDEDTFIQFRNDTAGITGDPDGKGGTVSGSKKAKVVEYIDSLEDLTPDQKTALLLDYNSSYSLKGVEWSNGAAKAPPAQPTETPTAEPTAAPGPAKLTDKGQQLYDGFVAAGIKENTADELARKLENTESSGHQQWREIYNAASYSDREKAVTSVMNDGAKRNWELAKNAGCSLDDYITVRENYLDLDGNGKQKQSEWNATLDQYTFSADEAKDKRIKGTLWQILTGSESTKNNPYDKDAGRQVIDAKSGGGSGSGSYAPARLRVRRQPWETGETAYQSRLRVAGASAPAAAGGRLRVSKK